MMEKIEVKDKMEEFNLSNKRTYSFNGNLEDETEYCYPEKDVKEFIHRLKEEVRDWDLKDNLHTVLRVNLEGEMLDKIDKLAGDKLI